METSINLLRNLMAALHSVGFGHRFAVSHWLRQYEPSPELRFHSSPIRFDMSHSLRSVRLALEMAAVARYWRSQPIAGAAASCSSRTRCFATPCRGNIATVPGGFQNVSS
jgi:hypothetical protein